MPDIREPHFSYPRSAVMFYRYAKVLVGNPLVIIHDGVVDFACYAQRGVPANGDAFAHQFYLAAGVYMLKVMGRTANYIGIIDWYLDGVIVVAGQDWYSAGVVNNVIKTSIVTVIGNGQHILIGVVNGKNVLSTNFHTLLSIISLV